MIAVNRWWHEGDKDWVTVPEGDPTDAKMREWGYTQKTPQYFAYTQPRPGTVPVFRWWNAGDRDWITLADGELSETQLQSFGYTQRTGPMFHAPRAGT